MVIDEIRLSTRKYELNDCRITDDDIARWNRSSGGGNILIGTRATWENVRGEANTVYVYIDKDSYVDPVDHQTKLVPGFKVGNGNGWLKDQAFETGGVEIRLNDHIANTTVHTTAEEKEFWNNKINIDDANEIHGELLGEELVFIRN